MLRYYDEAGILTPAEVDKWTGHRLYSVEQIPRLNKILYLRDSGLNVSEITLALTMDEQSLFEQLNKKCMENMSRISSSECFNMDMEWYGVMRGIKMPISKKEMQRRWEEKEAQRQNIIKNRDWNALFAMDENDDFSWTLEQILWSFVTNRSDGNLDLSNLNHTQKVLFLVLELENATQADALPNFFEEGFAVYGVEAVQALEEVGASQCAVALNAVVDTLPDGIYPIGDKEFWNSIMSGKNSDIWDKADRVFMDYTDGRFSDLCHIYAQAHRDTVQAD